MKNTFIKSFLVFYILSMMIGCGDSYLDKTFSAAEDMAKIYYSLLAQNKIEEACHYIDEKRGLTEVHGSSCDDGTALIFERISIVGHFSSYEITGGTNPNEVVEDYSFAEVTLVVTVTYENANFYEHFVVSQGEHSELKFFFCMDYYLNGERPLKCW